MSKRKFTVELNEDEMRYIKIGLGLAREYYMKQANIKKLPKKTSEKFAKMAGECLALQMPFSAV